MKDWSPGLAGPRKRWPSEVGKSRSAMAPNSILLLQLPESVKILVQQGKLTASRFPARLLSAADPEAMAQGNPRWSR